MKVETLDTPIIPEPGIYCDVSFIEYSSWLALNSSSLDHRSAHHTAARMRREVRSDSKSLDLGRMAHTAILEPDKFPLEYGVCQETNGRTKAAKEEKAAMQAIGKIPCTQLDWDIVCKMRDAVNRHLTAAMLLSTCKREVSIVWNDKATGLLCKARIDGIDEKAGKIVDLKTALDASPGSFAKSIIKYSYHRQLNWYCTGWATLTNHWPEFIWIVVEKLAPFGVAIYEPDHNVSDLGEQDAAMAIDAYANLDETEPPYGKGIQTISLPAWKLKQLEQPEPGKPVAGYGITIGGVPA